MTPEKSIRVLLADDHKMFLGGLQLIVDALDHTKVVGSVANGKAALLFLARNEVDLVILDLNMPVLNGLDTCKVIKKEMPHVKVLVLSMVAEIPIIKRVIKCGAMGFLLKESGKEKIEHAIKALMAGSLYFDEKILSEMNDPLPKKVKKDSLLPHLSKRELQILQLIVKEKTTSEIADELFIGFGTVESHRRNIITKLGVRNTAGIVRVAMENGLV